MRITRIDIKGFGRFRQQVFEPGPGVNLIHGPNEAGKSTLLAFIRAMLYGLHGGRRTRDGELPPLRRYEPWNGDIYQGVLEYALDSGASFRVGRNFVKGTVHLQDAVHNDITATFPLDRETGPQFMEAQTGLDEATFVRTLLVEQQQTPLDATGRRGLMDSLLRLMDAGRDEQSFRRAEEALTTALLERVGSERSTVRPLDRIQNRLAELQEAADEVRAQRETVRGVAVALQEANGRVAVLEARYGALAAERACCRAVLAEQERHARARERQAIRQRLDELQRQEAELAGEAERLDERLRGASDLAGADTEAFSRLPFDLGRLRELYRACERLTQDLARKRAEAEALGTELPDAVVWRDAERVGTVLREYLDLRERIGSTEERRSVLDALTKRPEHWGLRAAASAVLAGAAGFCAWSAWRDGASVDRPGALLLAAATPILFLLALGVLLPALIRTIAGRRRKTSGAEPVADREEIIRWNRARSAFEALMAEAGVLSLQEFLRQKGVVDTVTRRMDDLAQDLDALERQRRDAAAEADAIAARSEALFRAASVPEGLPEGERLLLAQAALQALHQDRARSAEINMRREAIRNETAAQQRALSALEEDADDEAADSSACGPVGSAESDACQSVAAAEASPLSPEEAALRMPEVQEMLERTAEELAQARLTAATQQTRLERVPPEEKLQQILEETDRLVTRRTQLEAYGASLRTAIDELRASADELRQGISPKLDRLSGEILSGLSDGRYRRIGTDDRLSLRVEVPESAEMPPVAHLSGGTADQAWLAVRLASLMLFEEGRETLPLFLDEPFAQFDEARARAALTWLRENAGTRQIFLFTCRERDRQLAEEVFDSNLTDIAL